MPMLLLSGCMQLPSTATEGKEVRYAHNKKREALTEDTRLDLGPLGAAAVLRARTDVLVDSALAHATAALGGGHRFGRVLLVEVIEAVAVLVAEALHVEVPCGLVGAVVVLGDGACRVPKLRDLAEVLGSGVVVAPDLIAERPPDHRRV